MTRTELLNLAEAFVNGALNEDYSDIARGHLSESLLLHYDTVSSVLKKHRERFVNALKEYAGSIR